MPDSDSVKVGLSGDDRARLELIRDHDGNDLSEKDAALLTRLALDQPELGEVCGRCGGSGIALPELEEVSEAKMHGAEPCPVCHGTGTHPDSSVEAVCPVCLGHPDPPEKSLRQALSDGDIEAVRQHNASRRADPPEKQLSASVRLTLPLYRTGAAPVRLGLDDEGEEIGYKSGGVESPDGRDVTVWLKLDPTALRTALSCPSPEAPEGFERAVEAVARRLFGELGEEPQLEGPENYRPLARAVIDAALPHLQPEQGGEELREALQISLDFPWSESRQFKDGFQAALGQVEKLMEDHGD